MTNKKFTITDENAIKNLIGKRIKVNVGNLFIEGLLGYYGKSLDTVQNQNVILLK